MTRRVSSPDLVGREEELSVLVAALEQAKSGEPQCVLVGGEAGVGKTRLLNAIVERAEEAGTRVLVGSCIELTDGHLPFAPVVQALRGFVKETDPGTAAELFGPAGDELGRLLPELGTQPETSGLGVLVFDSAQGRLFEAILKVLERLGEPDGVAFVFEDLHWADDSTRDLIAFLIRNMRRERLLLVGSYRSDELHRQHPLRPFLASLDSDRVDRVQLERLGRDEVRVQLRGILGDDPDEAFVDRVFDRSEGNPFFVEELLAAGTEDLDVELPSTVRDALILRVEVLSPTAQQVLRIASVAGRQVDHRLLAAVMELDEDELILALREAVSRHLLVPGRVGDSYMFRHALLREAVYEDLLPGERTRLHSSFARVLNDRPELAGGTGAASAAELAFHYFAAHDLESALLASIDAGRAAYEALAFSESRRHYERALELWDQVPDAAEKAGVDELELHRQSAEAALLMGDADRAAALFRAALELVDPEQDPVTTGLLQERIGRSLWTGGHGEAALAASKRAVEILPVEPPSPARARVLAAEGQMLMLASKFEEARLRCEEAIEIARRVGARGAEGHAMNSLGVCLGYLGDPDLGVEHLRRARAIAHEVGNVDDIARTYPNVATVLEMCAGNLVEAARECRDGITAIKELGLERSYGFWMTAGLASILFRLGDWDEAANLLSGIGDTVVGHIRAYVHIWNAEIATRRGEFDRAAEELRRMSDLAQRVIDPQFQAPYHQARAGLALWQGDIDDAAVAVAEGLRRVEDADDIGETALLYWLGIRVEIERLRSADAHRDEKTVAEATARATDYRDRALQLAGRARIGDRVFSPRAVASGTSVEAEWSRIDGQGDPDLWAAAEVPWRNSKERFELAYVLWRKAEAAVSANDKNRAEAALREAHEIASELRASPLLSEVEALARRARLRIEPSAERERHVETEVSPADEFGLTARELEVLRLVVEGRTNPQIAKELYISEKTASVHVSHILAKMGVSGRVEAAGLAHRLGVVEVPSD